MIQIGDPRHYDQLPPVEKLLTLVFAIAGRDQATELRFDYQPSPPAIQLWYCVDDQLYQLVPPPGELWRQLVRVLWRTARPDPAHRRPWWKYLRRGPEFPEMPVGGTLPVMYGRDEIEFDILFFRGRKGEHIWVERDPTIDVSAVSRGFLEQRWGRHDRPDDGGTMMIRIDT